ncbi:hypothetical protein [Microcoleus sp. D2_18a_D3]|uniref:hypothetical protein n=1 Tax=Microcoleus sp. D2_18a_D3 TaxID=3055330 RepID=UPI002FD60CBA
MKVRSPLTPNTQHCNDCTESDRPSHQIPNRCLRYNKIKLIINISKINMINLELPQSHPFTNLKVTLLLESLTSGEVAASVREFPDCQVKAETREAAIAQIQATFLERLKNIEAISWNVPIQALEPTWMKFAGVFKDDADFVAIMESIRAERTSDDDSEVDPSYYL